MDIKTSYITRIVNALKKLDVQKVILFGSQAYGNPDKDSDFDLVVVLNIREMPKTFDERMEYQLLVKQQLREINKDVSLDVLVYTLPMYRKFIEMGSMFAREITQNGKLLYEKDDRRMA